MEGEQFSLCWNNFHTNLSSGFQNLYKEEDLVDVTLAAEGKFIKAHKTVLSICSPYFKELFRVNPCKHPIVILQDINFNALCNLLQFMYEGQVSVSQEEIPIFMKVAETLKIKGLTDNGSPKFDSNGFNSSNSEQKNMLKKPMRPIKKPIKPTQQVQGSFCRTSGSPVGLPRATSVKSPMILPQPPAKRMHYETEPVLLRPKLEPIDDETTQSFSEEQQFDANVALQSTSTPESDTTGSSWIPDPNYKQPDTSTPDVVNNIFFLKSKKGQIVLVHDGHIYISGDDNNERPEGKACNKWICVKNKLDNCNGSLVILEGPILHSQTKHNHYPLNDVIQKLPLV